MAACSEIIDNIITNPDPRGTLAGTDLEIADIVPVYYRDVNAIQKLHETAFVIFAGLKTGDEVAFPEVPYSPQQFPERRPKSEGAKGRNLERLRAEAVSWNMLTLAANQQAADVVPDHSMLAAELSNARNNKALIIEMLAGAITIRLASLIARDTPAPDIPSYLAHASASNVMVKQWSLGILKKRSVQGSDEVKGSSDAYD